MHFHFDDGLASRLLLLCILALALSLLADSWLKVALGVDEEHNCAFKEMIERIQYVSFSEIDCLQPCCIFCSTNIIDI